MLHSFFLPAIYPCIFSFLFSLLFPLLANHPKIPLLPLETLSTNPHVVLLPAIIHPFLEFCILSILFCILIFIHEFGHFFFAKLFKVKVNEVKPKVYPELNEDFFLDLGFEDVKTVEVEPTEGLIKALCDDLNTPLALTFLHEDVNNLNKAETNEDKQKYKSQLLADAYMLGLLFQDAEVWFKGDATNNDAEWIEAKIQERIEAKKNKDWATADMIRNELKEQGVILEDSPQGTTWKRC